VLFLFPLIPIILIGWSAWYWLLLWACGVAVCSFLIWQRFFAKGSSENDG
jgi:hypothetical protein